MQQLHRLIQNSYAAQALYVLTKHKVFDSLMRGPMTVPALAAKCGLQRRSLEQLLLVAASLGAVRQTGETFAIEDQAFALTRYGRSWLRSYLLLWGEQLNPTFANLEAWATQGVNPFECAHGATIWQFYRQNSEANKRFVDFMDSVSEQYHVPTIVRELRVDGATKLVDVGGGKGALACALLAAHPEMCGVVFDQLGIEQKATERIVRAELTRRCQFVGGSMLESCPAGADLYLIKHVIHDWEDRAAVQILTNVRTAMSHGARLVIVEGILDHDCEDRDTLVTRNLEQMAWTSGKVRTLSEFEALTRAAGLVVSSVTHTAINDLSFINCVRAI